MNNILPVLLNDFYKQSHKKLFATESAIIYSTWTPRKSRIEGVNEVVNFGLQGFIKKYLIDYFNENFFNRDIEEIRKEYVRILSNTLGGEIETKHIEDLHKLGYLPIQIDAVKEGTLIPIRCPMFTIQNTLPEFYWVTNFLETLMSAEIWKPMTSATIALQYRKILDKWANKTCDNNSHVDFQGHDFSMRGMSSVECACTSGAGHLTSFKGTDTIPAICYLEKYYNANVEKEMVGGSIPATEHSIMCLNSYGKENDEYDAFKRIITEVHPSGYVSIVSDTWNLWEVLTDTLPRLKDEIMNRDGKLVVRPDSGDPCDIICGLNSLDSNHLFYKAINVDGIIKLKDLDGTIRDWDDEYAVQKSKGVIELLWDTFGGTINTKGYKVLDPHVGCIYGDAITLERAEEICRRLEAKGFASSNIVLGIGSYTYNMNTRDTFGFALKTTYARQDGKDMMLFKDPYTDDGVKKSQKGMVTVFRDERFDEIMYKDGLTWEEKQEAIMLSASHSYDEHYEMLQPVFKDGKLLREFSLSAIRRIIATSPERVAVGV